MNFVLRRRLNCCKRSQFYYYYYIQQTFFFCFTLHIFSQFGRLARGNLLHEDPWKKGRKMLHLFGKMLSRSKIFYYEVLQKVSSSNNHKENKKGGMNINSKIFTSYLYPSKILKPTSILFQVYYLYNFPLLLDFALITLLV